VDLNVVQGTCISKGGPMIEDINLPELTEIEQLTTAGDDQVESSFGLVFSLALLVLWGML